jgi:hypothetical protein
MTNEQDTLAASGNREPEHGTHRPRLAETIATAQAQYGATLGRLVGSLSRRLDVSAPSLAGSACIPLRKITITRREQ